MEWDEIREKYPNLYRHGMYFECGGGWMDLIDRLSAKLEKLIVEHELFQCDDENFRVYAVQVKEKFGELRFYMSVSTDSMDTAIEEAEAESRKTCEVCGKPGTIGGQFWVSTRCEGCKR